MSNSIFNIRFGAWHLHIDRDPFRIRVGHNPYHDRFGPGRRVAGWRWFEIMEAPWK